MSMNANICISTRTSVRGDRGGLISGLLAILLCLTSTAAGAAETTKTMSPQVKAFIKIDAPVFALTHVRVIDGTGGPVLEDQTVVVADGKINTVGAASSVAVPAGALVRDCTGYTVIPGLVGMHDHIIYPAGGGHYNTLVYSAPRLYLAGGVTTIRTTGGMETFTELNLKKAINEGRVPGPRMHVTSPFLEGKGSYTLDMRELSGPDDARAMVRFWAEQGVDDIKAYMDVSRAELKAIIDEAHKRGLKVAGHLGAVGFREAAELGIDSLEHGLFVDSEFVAGRTPDKAVPSREIRASINPLDVNGPEIQSLIKLLVARNVAVTSTLPVYETFTPGRAVVSKRVLDVLSTDPRVSFLASAAMTNVEAAPAVQAMFKKEMEFERAFVKAGGLLLAGPDPTGYGGVIPGFGDQRGIELLVEAGFTPVEAVRIATHNGALYLGELNRLGTVTAGKLADLVLIKGDPTERISDIENVEIVFKDGLGYDPSELIEACRGTVGLR